MTGLGQHDWALRGLGTEPEDRGHVIRSALKLWRAGTVVQGCLVLDGKDIELDVGGRQLEPDPYRRMRLHAGASIN